MGLWNSQFEECCGTEGNGAGEDENVEGEDEVREISGYSDLVAYHS